MCGYSPFRCYIYVEHSGDRIIREYLISEFQGKDDAGDVILPGMHIGINQNRPGGYPVKDRVFDAKYRMEIMPLDQDSFDEAQYKKQIADILLLFWKSGIDASAICEFDDELPESGGHWGSPVSGK